MMHSHPDHVLYIVKGGRMKITVPDGSSQEIDLKDGQAMWMTAGQHVVENLSETEAVNIVIELKK
jgi:mannose-6-phosphate isomerase-like protein (cupin superfamily)